MATPWWSGCLWLGLACSSSAMVVLVGGGQGVARPQCHGGVVGDARPGPLPPMLDLAVSGPDLLRWSCRGTDAEAQDGGSSMRRLLEALCGVVDAVPARQGVGRWWARQLGLLLIPALFSPSSAFLLARAGFVAELAGSTCCWPTLPIPVGGGLSSGLFPTLLLTGVPRGGGRVRLLLIHHRTLPSC